MSRIRVALITLLALVISTLVGVAQGGEFHGTGESFSLSSASVAFNIGTQRFHCTTGTLAGTAPTSASKTLITTPDFNGCERETSTKSAAEIKAGACQYEMTSTTGDNFSLSIVPFVCMMAINVASEPNCAIDIPGGPQESGGTASGTKGSISLAIVGTAAWTFCAPLTTKSTKGTSTGAPKGIFTGKGVWFE